MSLLRNVIKKAFSLRVPVKAMSSSKNPVNYLRDNMGWLVPEELYLPNTVPDDADVVIVGGGIMGSSIAYFLKRDESANLNVVVIEKDDTYTRASTVLSVGGIRQQFSNPENILLSLHSAKFMKNARELLCVDDQDPPDLCFNDQGYLFMATENGVETLLENHKIQKKHGASVELLTQRKLKEKFPFINTDGIELASYGLENEGWFDPWSLLRSFRLKAMSLGVKYVKAEVTDFEVVNGEGKVITNKADYSATGRRIASVQVSYPDSPSKESVKAPVIVLAAGPSSGEMGLKLGIGLGSKFEFMDVGIPVHPRKRYVYVVHCPGGPSIDCPLVVDPSGIYIRREGLGGTFLTGRSPLESEEPLCNNLDVDYDFFDETIWESLAHRLPAFEALKIKNAWAGFYDYNSFDQNAIIGYHPAYRNLIITTGFSGHGLQQAPAVGQAVSELILENDYKTVDVSAMGFDRILKGDRLLEKNVI